MGETRVDLLHLLEDLRDAYPGSLEETILTEVVANSLDSGATCIRFHTDPAESCLIIADDGRAMERRELSRYHDVAASTKTRGEGIGFAGVGIKLGLLVCEEVWTETRRGKGHVATRWHLASRHRAPWKWMPPPGMVGPRGTAVRLKLHNPLSPLLDPGFIEASLRTHYEPLFHPQFIEILSAHYKEPIRFEVNERAIEWVEPTRGEVVSIAVRMPHKRKPSAVGHLVRSATPLPEDQCGVAISTFGKVIKRGWEWLGLSPVAPDRFGGLIEAPTLSASLTLNKAEFIRTGARGAAYLAYRKAIQQAVGQQLAQWGDTRDTHEDLRRKTVRPIERDLETVLVDLAQSFPILAALVDQRSGGQKRLPMGRGPEAATAGELVAASIAVAVEQSEEAELGSAERVELRADGETSEEAARSERVSSRAPTEGSFLPGQAGPRRPARYGLGIQFESRLGHLELGRLVDSTVWINDAHPAYRRAVQSRSEGYHLALAVALALAPLAAGTVGENAFVNAFLARWGELLDGPKHRGRRKLVR